MMILSYVLGNCNHFLHVFRFNTNQSKQHVLRSVHTRELAPETRSRSRVSTPASTHEVFCSRRTLREQSSSVCTNDFMGKINSREQNFHPAKCSTTLRPVHTRELAPETDSCNRFAPGACSLISNQFDMREQNSGAKVLLRNIFFR